ncbi:hypothetical protein J5N97_013232 [Dioscorea zingiberensis]|uniref:Uncharacterized protein n=1 Tax=Dioscorea zingiberensis TaxID=325984 RepID=A0A9D5CQU9_9LILI|nr:hypothetical protein J5N97_013232 [Dioscorea zingiberensis]
METGYGSLVNLFSSSIIAYTPLLLLEKNMLKEYIYEPWSAPLGVQEKAKCIIGRDYPKPVEEKLSGLQRKLEEDEKNISKHEMVDFLVDFWEQEGMYD